MSARRSIVALSAGADSRFMYQMRKDGYCPVAPPSWLDLLGWTTAALVFGALAVIAYHKKVGSGWCASRRHMPSLCLCELLELFVVQLPCAARRRRRAHSLSRCAGAACSRLPGHSGIAYPALLCIYALWRHCGPPRSASSLRTTCLCKCSSGRAPAACPQSVCSVCCAMYAVHHRGWRGKGLKTSVMPRMGQARRRSGGTRVSSLLVPPGPRAT